MNIKSLLKAAYAMCGGIFIVLIALLTIILAYAYQSRQPTSIPQSSDGESVNFSQHNFNQRNREFITILSIDGGGVRGIIPLYILEYLERKTGLSIAKLFDFSAGTSAGSMVVSKSLMVIYMT